MKAPVAVESIIDIDASPDTVWRVLTDLARFESWNPFIIHARGDVRVEGVVRLRVRAPFRTPVPLAFQARITVCDRARELRWRGHFGAPWLGEGDHVFTLAPRERGRTRFLQRETFSGLLPRLLRPALVAGARRGFERMNRALAVQAVREARAAVSVDGAAP